MFWVTKVKAVISSASQFNRFLKTKWYKAFSLVKLQNQ